MSKRKKHKIVLPPKRRRPVQYVECVCCCCGTKFETTTILYRDHKYLIECPECESIRYEIDHPHFPETLDERLDKLELPREI